jgi:hypothetical protein
MLLNLTSLTLSALLGATSPTTIAVPKIVTPDVATTTVRDSQPDSTLAQIQARDQAMTARANKSMASRGPIASPRDTARATIGAAHVLVDYGRPSKRDRVIFGGLVPYDQVWRTGANMATTLVTDKALTIGNQTVPAGSYSLYTVPSKSSWQLIINKEVGQWGLTYRPEFDLGKTLMTVSTSTSPVEKFLIDFSDGKMRLQWDTTVVEVPIAEKQ